MVEHRTEDERNDLCLKTLRGGGEEVEFSIDPDDDLYIQVTNRKKMPVGAYLNSHNARKLKDWLNRVLP